MRNKFKSLARKGVNRGRQGFNSLKKNKKIQTFGNRTKAALKKTGNTFGKILSAHGDRFLDIGLNVGEKLLSAGMNKFLSSSNNAGNSLGNAVQNYLPPMNMQSNYNNIPAYNQFQPNYGVNYQPVPLMYGGGICRNIKKRRKRRINKRR